MSWFSDQLDSITDKLSSAWDSFADFGKDLLEEAFSIIGIEGYTVNFTNVQTVQLIPDEQLNGITRLIFLHGTVDTSMADGWRNLYLNGVTSNIEKFLEYAESDYIYGLPTTTAITPDSVEAAAKAVIESLISDTIVIESLRPNPIDYNRYTLYICENAYGMDYETTYINVGGWVYFYVGYAILGGSGNIEASFVRYDTWTKVYYLERDRVTVGGTTTVTIREISRVYKGEISYTIVETAAPYDITYPDKGEADLLWEEILWIDTADPSLIYNPPSFAVPTNPNAYGWLFIEYHLASESDAITHSWAYDRTLGTYPTLNIDPTSGIDTSQTLPVMPIRHDFISCDVDKGAAWYTTTAAMFKYLGLEVDTYLEELETNPDIDKIRDAHVHFGLNIYTERQGSLRAIRQLVEDMYEQQGTTEAEWLASTVYDRPVTNFLKVEEQSFNTMLHWNYITYTDHVGSPLDWLGIYFEADHVTYGQEIRTPISGYNGIYGGWGSNDTWNDDDADERHIQKAVPTSSYYIYEQLTTSTSPSTGTYRRWDVHGFVRVVSVENLAGDFNGHVHTLRDMDYTTAETEELSKSERDGFCVPLSLQMIENLSFSHKEDAIYDALRFSAYAADSKYLKYYQTSKFGVFVQFVGWAVTIITLGASSPYTANTAWVAKKLLTQFALALVLKEVLERVDSPVLRAAAIAVYAVASVTAGRSDNVFELVMSAEEMMMAVSALQTGWEIDTSLQLEGLQDEMDEFENLSRTREEELQAAIDYLDQENLSVFDVNLVLRTNHYERSSDFYNRTIHTGNPGVLSLSQIEGFVDQSLQLPRLK